MRVEYLNGVETLQELKQLYRKLVKEHHPDIGGDTAVMTQINLEFEYLYESMPKTKQEQASGESAEDYMGVVNKVSGLPDIKIELCGTWLWVTGSTYQAKDQLKAAGFRFSPKKQAWYWYYGKYRKTGRRQLSLDEIRRLYGTKELETKERVAIT